MVVTPVVVDFIDLLLGSITLGMPPLLMIFVVNKKRAFVWAVIWFWFLLIVNGQYHLAYTPDYDSIAPGLSIVAGWVPATVYAGFWLCAVWVLQYVCGNYRRTDPSSEKPRDSNEPY